eukprot:scaffold12316_cov113-Isochrysis_galbana.AAC.4
MLYAICLKLILSTGVNARIYSGPLHLGQWPVAWSSGSVAVTRRRGGRQWVWSAYGRPKMISTGRLK